MLRLSFCGKIGNASVRVLYAHDTASVCGDSSSKVASLSAIQESSLLCESSKYLATLKHERTSD